MSLTLDDQGLPAGYPLQKEWELSPRAVEALCSGDEPVLLLDCRLDREVAAAHIEGATHIPMQALPGRVDELADFEEQKVVVFCHGGVRSLRVTQFLRERGFEDVWSMAGGIDLWSLAVDASVPRY